jgi:negative regulator of sigma E activity
VSDNDPIEDALRKLRPAEFESALMARLSAARPCKETLQKKSAWREVLLRWLLPLATSACVAIATFLFLEHNRTPDTHESKPDGTALADAPPVESQDYLVSARPVGIVVAPNQQPYRIMDVQWLEYETVRASANGPALHTATTRRDVIPIALELY